MMEINKEGDQQWNKAKSVERFKALYRQKNNADLSDEDALEYFEQLLVLVAAITSHIPVSKIIRPNSAK